MLGFTYVRVWQAGKDVYADYPTEPQTLRALQAVLVTEGRKKLITRLYSASLQEGEPKDHTSYNKWLTTLGDTFTTEQWRYCCMLTGRLTTNCNLHIIHFTFLHQLYYTPSQL